MEHETRSTARGRGAVGAPDRVLIKAPNWLGDLVMTLPALRALRVAYPQARLAVLVRRELAGLYDGCRWIDRVVPYSVAPGVRGIADRARLIGELRGGRYDLAVVLPKSFESVFWVWLAGIPRRAGFRSDGRSWMLTNGVPLPRLRRGHQSGDYLDLLRNGLGVAAIDDQRLEVAQHHREQMESWLAARGGAGPLIAMAVSAAYGPAKEWPEGRYVGLIERLESRYGVRCVLVGAPGERERCRRVAQASAASPIVAAGETTVGQLVALLSLCDGFAGNDSGAMHVAAAVGIPTVGVFGSTDPERTGPRGRCVAVVRRPLACSPCLERTCRYGHYDCLNAITVDAVEGQLVALGALRRATA